MVLIKAGRLPAFQRNKKAQLFLKLISGNGDLLWWNLYLNFSNPHRPVWNSGSHYFNLVIQYNIF